MSARGLARFGAKRDANEPEIRARFAMHNWHTEQVSGKGMPDLIAWPIDPVIHLPHGRVRTLSALVDVKMPKGGFMPAQVEKWAALAAKGIPVYVARSEADVDAIVSGTAEPWSPAPKVREVAEAIARSAERKALRALTVEADAGQPLHVVRGPGSGSRRVPTSAVYRRRKP